MGIIYSCSFNFCPKNVATTRNASSKMVFCWEGLNRGRERAICCRSITPITKACHSVLASIKFLLRTKRGNWPVRTGPAIWSSQAVWQCLVRARWTFLNIALSSCLRTTSLCVIQYANNLPWRKNSLADEHVHLFISLLYAYMYFAIRI